MDVIKKKLAPFVAKYGTRLDIDVDMFEQLTGVELIYAMSAKINEAVCFINSVAEGFDNLANLYGSVSVEDTGGMSVGAAYKIPGAFVTPEITGTLPLEATNITFSDSFELNDSILMSEVVTDVTPTEAFANYGVRCVTISGKPTIAIQAQSGTGTFRIPPQIVPFKEL